MAGNIVNMKDLDDYLKDVVYRGQEKEIFTDGYFNSIEFVEQHKDAIVRSMLLEWTNHTLRSYMSTKTPQTVRFLPMINVADSDLPTWARRCMDEGKQVYRFMADRIPDSLKDKITTVRDYLYAESEKYVNKVLAQAKDTQKKYAANPNAKGNKNLKKPRIRIDFLKTGEEYADFNKVLMAAQKWHEAIAGNKKFKKFDNQLYQESLAGTMPEMELGDGMQIMRLTTPEALDFESDYMGHCVGKGAYDEEIKEGSVEIYSLRDEYGEPHATFEVRFNAVQQCKGKNDKAPVEKYRPYVQAFVRAKKLDIDGDMQNIGLIKHKNEYYDMFNLPKNKKIVLNGSLSVAGLGLTRLPDFSNLVVKGSFNCSDNKLTDLYGSPLQVGSTYDCSNNNLTSLDGISKRVGLLNISKNPITSLKGLPQIDRDSLTAVDVAIENTDELPSEHKGEVGDFMVSNWDKNIFIINQDGKNINLLEQPDGFVVKGDIYLDDCGLEKLPDLSHIIVEGGFYCNGNQLTSLVGSPKEVGGDFEVCDNRIVNLEGMPKKVGGRIEMVSNHHLKSLRGIATEVGKDINISDCPELKNVDVFPQKCDSFLLPEHLEKKYNLSWKVSAEQVKKAAAAHKMLENKATREAK